VSAALALVLGPPGRPSATALAGLAVAVVPAVAAAVVGGRGAPGVRSRAPFLLALAAAAADLCLLVCWSAAVRRWVSRNRPWLLCARPTQPEEHR
jgi:hypothetical protein